MTSWPFSHSRATSADPTRPVDPETSIFMGVPPTCGNMRLQLYGVTTACRLLHHNTTSDRRTFLGRNDGKTLRQKGRTRIEYAYARACPVFREIKRNCG